VSSKYDTIHECKQWGRYIRQMDPEGVLHCMAVARHTVDPRPAELPLGYGAPPWFTIAPFKLNPYA
jgi:hypothetical protein